MAEILALVKADQRLKEESRRTQDQRAEEREACKAARELFVDSLTQAKCDRVTVRRGDEAVVVQLLPPVARYERLTTVQDVLRHLDTVGARVSHCAPADVEREAVQAFRERATKPSDESSRRRCPRLKVVPGRDGAQARDRSAPSAVPPPEVTRLATMYCDAKQACDASRSRMAPLRRAVRDAQGQAAPHVSNGAVSVRISSQDGQPQRTVSVVCPEDGTARVKPIGFRNACKCVSAAAKQVVVEGSGTFDSAKFRLYVTRMLTTEFERLQAEARAKPPAKRARVAARVPAGTSKPPMAVKTSK